MSTTSYGQDLEKEEESIKDQVVEKAAEAQSYVREKAEQVMETVREAGNEARQKFQEGYETTLEYLDQGRQSLKKAGSMIEKEIRQYPLLSLFVGGAIGYFLGAALKRRSRD